jgi:hypothetical protein
MIARAKNCDFRVLKILGCFLSFSFCTFSFLFIFAAYTGIPLVFILFFLSFTMYRIYAYVRAITLAVSRYDFSLSVANGAANNPGSRQHISRSDSRRTNPQSENSQSDPSHSGVAQTTAASALPPANALRTARLRDTALQAFLYLLAYVSRYAVSFTANHVEVFG